MPDSEFRAADRIHPPIETILDALSFRVARLAAVNERAGTIRFRESFGLKLTEWRVLGITAALEPLGFDQLRKLLVIDKGQLSRTVRALVERGVLAAEADPQDARRLVLTVTPEGRKLHDEVLAFAAERNEAVVAPLTRAECAEFLRLLAKITRHNEDLADLAGHMS